MIEPIGIYHIGIPVDDIQRAEVFYTKTLGMTVADRLGEAGARLTRLKCGDAGVFSPWARSAACALARSIGTHLKRTAFRTKRLRCRRKNSTTRWPF